MSSMVRTVRSDLSESAVDTSSLLSSNIFIEMETLTHAVFLVRPLYDLWPNINFLKGELLYFYLLKIKYILKIKSLPRILYLAEMGNF